MTYPRQLDNLSQKYWELSKHETITFQTIQNDITHHIHLKSNQDAMTSISHGGMIRISFKKINVF